MSTRREISRADMLRKRRLERQQVEQRKPIQKAPVQPAPRTLTSGREVFRTSSVYSGRVQKPQEQKRNPVSLSPKGHDYAFSLGKTDVRTPALTVPHPGARLVSGAMTLVLVFIIYSMFTSAFFSVSAADVKGNQRLSSETINSILGIHGKSILDVSPNLIRENVRSSFADISTVTISINFPNRVSLKIVERTPVIAWYQDGNVTWIDSHGVAFPQRGDFPGLVQISANGSPADETVDATNSAYDQEFILPEMVTAILQLAPDVPAGSPMIFDPQYGMGWQDPRGWYVYFGQNTSEIANKLKVYSAIVDTFSRQGIQPTLVSMEYLDAPFYK